MVRLAIHFLTEQEHTSSIRTLFFLTAVDKGAMAGPGDRGYLAAQFEASIRAVRIRLSSSANGIRGSRPYAAVMH